LLVNYGRDQTEALRRLANVRTTLQKLGHVEFDIIAMQAEAVSQRNAGDYAAGLKQLTQALSIATERRLRDRVASIMLDIADSHILQSEYGAARSQLDKLLATDVGREDLETHIALGRVDIRMGDFAAARGHLERALAGLEAVGRIKLAPIAHTSLGELEYESGRLHEARSHFEKSAAFWKDDLVDAASLEARCFLGLLDSLEGKGSRRGFVEASVEHARRMGRLSLETRCRLYLARIQIAAHQYADALAVVRETPLDGERRVSPELEAQVRYWRSRALTELRDQKPAETEQNLARKLVYGVQESLPEQYRAPFALRTEIRPLIR
jgi:tetratricopeptide (TPR) repeat protein